MTDIKKDEVTLTIFVPSLLPNSNNETIYEVAISKDYGVPVVGHKIQFEDSNEFAILVADRELTGVEANTFFQEIMEYHQATNEELSEEEMAVRDEEVKTKWLNGNFNWWCLGAGKRDFTLIKVV
jgi:hypothetical protein